MGSGNQRAGLPWHRKAVLWLGGEEKVGVSSLPVEEFAHPLPLLGLLVLGLNDHVLKGSGLLPGWMTGKLSDFAGLFWFPLFVTALLDTLLFLAFRLSGGRTPDYSLSRTKVLASLAFTAILFVPLKLSDAWGSLYIRAMHALDVLGLFERFAVVRDPTDLVALAMFPLVYLFALQFIRRVPIGRLSVLGARAASRPSHERAALLEEGTLDVRSLARSRQGAPEALDAFLKAFEDALPVEPASAAARRATEKLEAFRRCLEQGR
ncbi:MAG: hypothetical protein RBU30_13435 [Polyangia bacterium]|jgi:hypothetical protein|nr:hypothetical protein [Polyangia bacterium]